MNEHLSTPNDFWKLTDGLQDYYKELIIIPARNVTKQLGWQVHSKIQPGGNEKWFDYVEGEIDLEEMKILINMELL